MSNNYTEGSEKVDIGAAGNKMLVELHEEVREMMERGEDWRTVLPPPSDLVQRLYTVLSGNSTEHRDWCEELGVDGDVEFMDLSRDPADGVWLHADEQFPDDYFAALIQFVLREIKSPKVVGWECALRCDKPQIGQFGGTVTCVSALRIWQHGTAALLRDGTAKLEAEMLKHLAEGKELP